MESNPHGNIKNEDDLEAGIAMISCFDSIER
jgi:hypothetical protein